MAFGTVSGTFQGTNASIPASFASALSTGSGAVNVGDIVVCLVVEQTALTVTSVTDSQANTYTAQNAGTLSGANVSGRLFWTRITAAGTLTSVTATCTASADDGVIIAAIIQGPFLASPVDVNLANAPDLSSPFTAPASGTMAQTTEVVVSWCASTGSAAFTGTSPTIIAIQQASAAVVEGVIGTQVPPSTATVTPTYTGTAPTANELGTISFKGAIAELDTAYSQPLSIPPMMAKVKGTFATAMAASGLFSPVIQPTLQNTRWLVQLSEPVQAKRGLHPSSQDVNAEVYFPPGVRTNWLVPLSEPVRKAPIPNKVNLFPFSAQAGSALGMGWFTPLSEPIRVRTSPANQQVLAFAPNPIVATGWSVPLSEPARVKLRAIADYAYAPLAISEVVTIDKWFNPLAPPLSAKPGLLPSSQQALALVQAAPFPETVTESRWHQSWSEPVRQRQALASANQTAFFGPSTVISGEIVTVNKWFAPFLDPVRKPGLGTGSQQSLAFVKADPFPESVTEDRWHQPWSEPARFKSRQLSDSAFAPITVTTEIVTSDKWFTPLTDPARRIPAAQKVNLFPFTAVATVAVETVTVDKWFVSFTDPVRVKPQLATGLQQTLAFVEADPFAETVTESRWHQPWSEPLRSKPGLSAANQAAFFAPSRVITSEIVTADKWFQQLSDPTRRKPEDRDRYNGENDWTAVAVSMEWFAPLNEPVRQKIGLATSQQQTLTFVTVERITVDKWFAPFQDPVRVKPALLTGRQQFLTWPTQIIIPSLASWWRPLAEPPKAKAGLLTANQRFETRTADFIPHPNQFLEGWFNWLSEPVRKLAQLNVALQRAWFGPDRNAVQATVTATMAVTEVNGDVAIFAVKVLPYNAPATAVVSLVEIGHGASLTSIVEEGDDGSGTSIVEN